MNLADILVILFILSIFGLWFYFKNRSSKSKRPSKCAGCSNYGLCKEKKEEK